MMSAKEMNIITTQVREKNIGLISKIDAFIANDVEKYVLRQAKQGMTCAILSHDFGPCAAETLAKRIRSYGYLVKLLPYKQIQISW